jgi:hypothetical protein
MIENWVDFGLEVCVGAIAFLCLFEGTRRLCAFGAQRKAVLLTLVAVCVCLVYGAFAYWKYTDLRTTLSVNQQRLAPRQGPANWSSGTSPEKREALDREVARQRFEQLGTLGTYVGRKGEIRTFTPDQEDLLRRERTVAYYARVEYAARSSLAEALLWLIMSAISVVLGFAMSFDRRPTRARPDDALPGDASLSS